MTAAEKEILYGLLSTAEDSLAGFASNRTAPNFEDDSEEQQSPSVPVLIVGEKPETRAEATLLDKMLRSISLSRETNCSVTSIDGIDSLLALNKPVIILALGEATIQKLLCSTDEIQLLRGRLHDFNGISVLATFSPGELIANETLKRPVWEDLKIFKTQLENRIGELPPLPVST